MAKRTYTDEDRAAVKLALEVNRGNIKSAARDTGVPYMTVQNWKKKWEREGLPAPVQDALPALAQDFTSNAVKARDSAIIKINELIPDATIKDLRSLATLVGILDDKVRLAQGLATSHHEIQHVHSIDPEAVGQAIGTHLREALDAALQRDEEIIDAEVEEQAPALLALTS